MLAIKIIHCVTFNLNFGRHADAYAVLYNIQRICMS